MAFSFLCPAGLGFFVMLIWSYIVVIRTRSYLIRFGVHLHSKVYDKNSYSAEVAFASQQSCKS